MIFTSFVKIFFMNLNKLYLQQESLKKKKSKTADEKRTQLEGEENGKEKTKKIRDMYNALSEDEKKTWEGKRDTLHTCIRIYSKVINNCSNYLQLWAVL